MKTLSIEQVTFEISIEPEYEPIENALSFSVTGADHSEYINKVIEDGGYNTWLWCIVKVTAKFKGLEGVDFLGQCAYENENEFIKGGYYEQMKDSAFEELKNKVNELVKN